MKRRVLKLLVFVLTMAILISFQLGTKKMLIKKFTLGYLATIQKEMEMIGFADFSFQSEIDILAYDNYKDITFYGRRPVKGSLVINASYNISSALLCVDNYEILVMNREITKMVKNNCEDIGAKKIIVEFT